MERTVKIRLRRGNVILEASGDQVEHFVDDAEHRVAFKLGVDDNADGVKIVDLVKAFALIVHFFINAEDRFYAPRHGVRNFFFGKLFADLRLCILQKIAVFAVAVLNVLFDLFVADRVEVLQRQIFKLALDFLNTETVGKRCVDVHGLERDAALFCVGLCREGAHIVQTVGKLDEDDADVFGHGKKHLAQVLDAFLFAVFKVNIDKLCKPVDQLANLVAEHFADRLAVGFVLAVLERVVQKGGAHRVGVQLQLRDDDGDGYGVRDIFLTRAAKLPFVQRMRIIISFFDLIKIVLGADGDQLFIQFGVIIHGGFILSKGTFRYFPAFCRRRARSVLSSRLTFPSTAQSDTSASFSPSRERVISPRSAKTSSMILTMHGVDGTPLARSFCEKEQMSMCGEV